MEKELFCGTQQVIPGGQDSAILPTQVANHSVAGFDSHCPVTELAYNIPILVFSYFSKTLKKSFGTSTTDHECFLGNSTPPYDTLILR